MERNSKRNRSTTVRWAWMSNGMKVHLGDKPACAFLWFDTDTPHRCTSACIQLHAFSMPGWVCSVICIWLYSFGWACSFGHVPFCWFGCTCLIVQVQSVLSHVCRLWGHTYWIIQTVNKPTNVYKPKKVWIHSAVSEVICCKGYGVMWPHRIYFRKNIMTLQVYRCLQLSTVAVCRNL